MQAQPFLSLLQNQYAFDRANHILSDINLKHTWKHWLTAELVYALTHAQTIEDIDIDTPYPNKATASKASDTKSKATLDFLSFKNGDSEAKAVEKRSASKCDFSFNYGSKQVFVEVRCTQSAQILKAGEFRKFTDDTKRVQALKKANSDLSILTLFAVYGRFENKDMKKLEPLDNNQICSYVLDTCLSGSSSIARLSHVQREGESRTLLVASSA